MIYLGEDRVAVEKEFIRLGFDKDGRWRISDVNKDFQLCNTYPRFLIVPSTFKDEHLPGAAKFRYFSRIPTAVWRHLKNGCFIVRSSQPTVGWFGWFRTEVNELDEGLVQSYVKNTVPPESERSNDDNDDDNNQDASIDNSDDRQALMMVEKNDAKLNDGDEEENKDKMTPQYTASYLDQDQQSILKLQSNHSNIHNDSSGALNSDNETTITATTSITPATSTSTPTTQSISSRTPSTLTAAAAETTTPPRTPTPTLTAPPTRLSPTTLENDTNSETSISAQPEQSLALNGNGALSSDISTVDKTNTTITSRILIIDARSYTAAMANRAKGGGCECAEYYQRCEVLFMNLANIHSIRKSFYAIRSVCDAYSEQSNNWVSFLDNSRWLHHISNLLKSALLVVDTIDIEYKSILVHCSDGWDRTPQLVALAEIMLDPHYRTFEGFRTLIQREWLDYGHKFADRCGSNPCNDDPNERCPVFLQWLDCVQQLLMQYPKHFEFNSFYLDKLNRHTYSNVFGTFSYNSTQERILSRIDEKILSLWAYFDSSRRRFKNERYVESNEVLRPSYKVRDLHFWKEVYLPPHRHQAPYIPIANNIDNRRFYDSLYIDGLRAVCK